MQVISKAEHMWQCCMCCFCRRWCWHCWCVTLATSTPLSSV